MRFRTMIGAAAAVAALGMASTAPAAAQNLRRVEFEDGTGSIGLAAGWTITGVYRGSVSCSGPNGADPRTTEGWAWHDAGPNTGWDFSQNNDEHVGAFVVPGSGSYRYVFRFRVNAGWTYCDADSSNGGFDPTKLPLLTAQ